MKKRLLLLLCLFGFLFSSRNTIAQKNFVKGSIITADGETAHGLIDYRNWVSSPDKIFFKKSEQESSIKLTPADIKSFKVKNDYYVSRIALVNKSPRVVEYEDLATEPALVLDTLFLSVLVEGRASLLKWVDHNNYTHYLAELDNKYPKELIMQRYRREVNGKKGIQTYDKYKEQLVALLNECPSIIELVDDLDYRSSSLKKVFIRYNSCTNAGTTFVKKVEKLRVTTRIIAGLSRTTISHERPTSSPFDFGTINLNLNSMVNPMLGLSFDIIFPRNRKKWSINNELVLKKYSVKTLNENESPISEYSVDATYLKFSSLARYTYPSPRIHPYLNLGMYYAHSLQLDDERTTFFSSGRVRKTPIE